MELTEHNRFASGKPNALVVDIGANTVSVTPISDGFVLKKGIQKSNLAGNFLSNQLRLQFAQMTPPVPLVPHYMVKSKQPVDAGQSSNATYVTYPNPPTDSFRLNEEERIFTSFKESMVQVWQGPGKLENTDAVGSQPNVDAAKSLPLRPFEMPDGWNQVFGIERFKVAEGLFDNKAALTDAEHPPPAHHQTLTQLVNASLNAVDMEIRPTLLSNIVLTGGGSQIEKIADRLHMELSTMFPNPRVRVHASNVSTDRKYGSWLGGSILASLGTFHQVSYPVPGRMMTRLTCNHRCGYQRRNTRSTDRASSKRDASRFAGRLFQTLQARRQALEGGQDEINQRGDDTSAVAHDTDQEGFQHQKWTFVATLYCICSSH